MRKTGLAPKPRLIDALKKGKIGLIDDPGEEQELLEAYETGKLIPIENREEKKRELIEAARNTPTKTIHHSPFYHSTK